MNTAEILNEMPNEAVNLSINKHKIVNRSDNILFTYEPQTLDSDIFKKLPPPQRKTQAPSIKSRPIASPEFVMRSFNTWAFKREQPSDPELLTQFIADATRQNEPIPFVCYWGKGPRDQLAFPDIACLDYIHGLSRRVQQVYAPGTAIKLVFTDTHARHNGHTEQSMRDYFRAVEDHAKELGFSSAWLSEIVEQAGLTATDELPLDPLQPEMLEMLCDMAAKWYRGGGSVEQGASEYYRMNMVEKRAIELIYPRSTFITFNGSESRNLFPRRLPIFYMYSLRRGVSIKPWFLSGEADDHKAQGE